MRQQQQLVDNTNVITEYLQALQIETNSSSNYTKLNKTILNRISEFHGNKIAFKDMKRNDVVTFLNSIRKTDKQDPMHKWIGTYNNYLVNLSRFFKWLDNPDLEHGARPRSQRILNLPKLRRKETSVYKPSDLWTLEDDLLFFKLCPNDRDKCYHAISRDLSARPHEILNLKIKDIIFKNTGNKQYAQVSVNGKTGNRHLPLIDSLPYIKQWLDKHPFRHNMEAYFICSLGHRTYGKQLKIRGLQFMYERYKELYFPNLLKKDSAVSKEDRQRIQELLLKPWNPYIRRHSSLTQKSKFLKEHILRQHAGWSPRSNVHLKYVHYFGNESSESILQEYGILPKDNQEVDVLRPKQCPQCLEANRPDQKFCTKCKMVLSIDAFEDTIKEQQEKEAQIRELIQFKDEMKALMSNPKKFIEMLQENKNT